MGGQLLAAVNDLKKWADISTQVAQEATQDCIWWQSR